MVVGGGEVVIARAERRLRLGIRSPSAPKTCPGTPEAPRLVYRQAGVLSSGEAALPGRPPLQPLRLFFQQLQGELVRRAAGAEADLDRHVGGPELLPALLRAQVHARQLMAAEVPHLRLEAAAELLHEPPGAVAVLRRVVPAVLEADGHHRADDGAADGARATDTAAKAAGDPGDRLVLDAQLLAHGQQNRPRSGVPTRQP